MVGVGRGWRRCVVFAETLNVESKGNPLMFVTPLTPSLNTQVNQNTLDAANALLPGNESGLSGLGLAGCGGGCGCDGKCGGGGGGLGDMISDAGPVASLVIHIGMALLAVSAFKYAFTSTSSGFGARRASIARAQAGVSKAQAKRAKLHPF